ncbi:MAG TPA: hypothetical protein VHV51_16270 [Polyangiaceae bacterium]|nr:hypothetical protein [Polyangiaceae bacterium]
MTRTQFVFSLAALCVLAGCGGGGGATNPDVEVSEADPSDARSTSEDLTKNALTQKQEQTTLKLIDDICGDTWCDGDFNFGFRKLVCAKAAHTCTLTLQVFPNPGVPASAKSYWRSCKTSGFTGFSSLVNTASSGYQSLASDYYDALTECTQRIVAKLE